MQWERLFVTGLVPVVMLFACEERTELEPAPGATQEPGMPGAAVSDVNGVNVVVQTDAWTGRPEVLTEVTPLRVTIRNNSQNPLVIRYNTFAMVSPTGVRYSALPPYRIEGEIDSPRLGNYNPVNEPGFEYDRFDVAPYYSPVYPGLSAYGGPFYTDRYYYNYYSSYWNEIELPTAEMLQRVLPEGVIQPGGSVAGFLYFEKIPSELELVRFRADLVNAQNGNIFGEISIPLLPVEPETGVAVE